MPSGEFECVVMHPRFLLVDLSKDRRPRVYCSRFPTRIPNGTHNTSPEKASSVPGRCRPAVVKSSWRDKPTCTGIEVVGRKLVTDLDDARVGCDGGSEAWNGSLTEPAPGSSF